MNADPSEVDLLRIAREICSDLDFNFIVALKEFIYELENYRINHLKPPKVQLDKWSKESDGISLFVQYLEKKTGHPWISEKAIKLWKIYIDTKKYKTRNIDRQSIIESEFIKNGKLVCNHCQKILNRRNVEIDHILPVSYGGNSKKENIQILCKKCNHRKRNKFWIIL